VKGLKLSGNIGIAPKAIELELRSSLRVPPVQGTRRFDVIEREVQNWIGKASAGDSPLLRLELGEHLLTS